MTEPPIGDPASDGAATGEPGERVVELPPMAGALDALWDLVLDIAERVPPDRWALIGGQMVLIRGLAAGRTQARVSRDVDVLADLLSDPDGLATCVRAVRDLGLDPVPDSSGRVYRFRREGDGVVADVLAPDHHPPRRSLRTAAGGDTITVDGGRQALQRVEHLHVLKTGRHGPVPVPVPDMLGALVLKAAAWAADSRDPGRHSGDAAFLVSLIHDPLAVRGRFAGSDRKRLLRLDRRLHDERSEEWRALGEHAPDAITNWQLLLA
jgi:hypothetical protein